MLSFCALEQRELVYQKFMLILLQTYADARKLKLFCCSDEALGYAQSNFTPFGKEQKYVQRLEVCSSNKYIIVIS